MVQKSIGYSKPVWVVLQASDSYHGGYRPSHEMAGAQQSSQGLGSPLPHPHRDLGPPSHICTGTWAHPRHICTGTWAHPCHICTGTGRPLADYRGAGSTGTLLQAFGAAEHWTRVPSAAELRAMTFLAVMSGPQAAPLRRRTCLGQCRP